MLRLTRPVCSRVAVPTFARLISTGAALPSAQLREDSPSQKVDLADETSKGTFIVVGVPGAFSPGCSQRHIPEYLKLADDFKSRGVKNLFVVAVNDAFVTKAWKEQLSDASGWARFLADPKGEFSNEFNALFDAAAFFGNKRSKRYAVVVKDGKITETFVEPDATGIDKSAAEEVLKTL